MLSEFEFFTYTRECHKEIPSRPAHSNKGTFGRVLCICGSSGMAGAAYFTAKAAYRTGAGLVEIITPEENRVILQTLLPEAVITVYVPEEDTACKLLVSLAHADAVVIGCGLGKNNTSAAMLHEVLTHVQVPCVVDADGLNLIADGRVEASLLRGKIITPHPGEMSRLCRRTIAEVTKNIPAYAVFYAKEHGCICVLKDHETVVSDGTLRIYRNGTGNSGMATGGCGDVLAGMIGSLLAQGRNGLLSLMEAACLGVYLHGLAGDIAAERLGEYALMASDVIDAIGEAMR